MVCTLAFCLLSFAIRLSSQAFSILLHNINLLQWLGFISLSFTHSAILNLNILGHFEICPTWHNSCAWISLCNNDFIGEWIVPVLYLAFKIHLFSFSSYLIKPCNVNHKYGYLLMFINNSAGLQLKNYVTKFNARERQAIFKIIHPITNHCLQRVKLNHWYKNLNYRNNIFVFNYYKNHWRCP